MKKEIDFLKAINEIGGVVQGISKISDNCYSVGLDVLGRELKNISISLEKNHLICLAILAKNNVI